jgi:pimeloyl-ACP methyl ester carboxylesterase
MKPTIVLAHGAFADSSSWDEVVTILEGRGHRVISVAVPLRGVASDARYLSDVVRTVTGPVVLVGHSYGGAVISSTDRDAGDIRALVYVAAFAGEAGESCASLSGKFPGSTLGPTLTVVDLSTGGRDLYIDQDRYHHQFCADVTDLKAAQMAAGQRPILESALAEPFGPDPLWKTVPSWFIWGEVDYNIPAQAHAFMAQRANARTATEVAGASHVVGITHPNRTAAVITRAAGATLHSRRPS